MGMACLLLLRKCFIFEGMKRSGFLKSLVTLIVAPSLLGDIEIKPFNEEKPQVFNSDFIRFYSDNIEKFRLGDLIYSDMGDKAMVVNIVNFGKGQSYAEARPVMKGQYRYRDISNVIPIGIMIAA